MLVLQRKENESIIIDGGTIKVTILRTYGDGRVRVGIEAPRAMPVHREEVHLAILRQLRGEEDNKEDGDAKDGE